MKAGLCWPSPSSVTTTGARACATPVRTAADWPQDCACLIWRRNGRLAIRQRSSASVPSVEALSANTVRPPLRLLMLAEPALLISKNDVMPPLFVILALPAVVNAWKIVSPPVSRLVMSALPALAVSLPPCVPKIVCPPFNASFDECETGVWPSYNPTRAKQLIDLYKAEGNSTDATLLCIVSQTDPEYIQQTLAKIGLNVKIDCRSQADYVAQLNAGNFQLSWSAMTSFATPYPKVYTYFQSENRNLPGFVVLGNTQGIKGGPVNWSAGFLPTTYQGTLFRSQGSPLLNLKRPRDTADEDQRAQLTFRRRQLFGTATDALASLIYENLKQEGFTETRAALSLRWERRPKPRWIRFLRYNIQDVRIGDITDRTSFIFQM